MRRITLGLLSLAVAPALLAPVSVPAQAKDGVGAALVGGLIAGAAIGAAVADSKNHPKTVYVEPPPPPPPPRNQAFSPKAGVTCYPNRQACYNNNGSYNGNWTWKIYAH